MAGLPEGFTLDEAPSLPEGFVIDTPDPVRQPYPKQPGFDALSGYQQSNIPDSSAIAGAVDIMASGPYNAASMITQGLSGIGGGLQGADPVKSMQQGELPEYNLGEDAQNLMGQAAEMFSSLPAMVQKGLSNLANAGDISAETVFEWTGKPELAAITKAIPEAVASMLSFNPAVKSVEALGKAALSPGAQPKGLQEIAQRLAAGDTSKELAPYSLEPEKVTLSGGQQPLLPAPEAQGRLPAPAKGSFATVKNPTPRARIDVAAKSALDEGWDAGIVSGIEQLSPLDRRKMSGMLNIMEKVKKDPMGTEVWPANIIGHSIDQRLKPLFRQNKEAGLKLNKEAARLEGQKISYEPIRQKLMDGLDDLGIKYNETTRELSFSGSQIEMNPAAEKNVKTFLNRLLRVGNDDALVAHNLKKWIDTQVEFGTQAKDPMVNSVKNLMKDTRRNINESLREISPAYKDANIKWSDTRTAIDKLDELTGTRTNLESGDVNEALGLLSRKLITNYSSGVDLRTALKLMEKTAKKYGANFSDNIDSQVKFNEELNRVLGAAKRGSFQGQTEQGVSKGVIRSGIRSVKGAAGRAAAGFRESRGVLEADELDAQIKAMRNYLESKK